MSNPCTLIRICPFTKTVEAVEWDGTGHQLAGLVRDPDGKGSGLFDYARAPNGIDLIVDDEGLYMGWPAFTFAPYGASLVGRALVASSDSLGNTVAPPLGVESIAAMVRWDTRPREPGFTILTGADALKAMGW
jgi:hypothetical protein